MKVRHKWPHPKTEWRTNFSTLQHKLAHGLCIPNSTREKLLFNREKLNRTKLIQEDPRADGLLNKEGGEGRRTDRGEETSYIHVYLYSTTWDCFLKPQTLNTSLSCLDKMLERRKNHEVASHLTHMSLCWVMTSPQGLNLRLNSQSEDQRLRSYRTTCFILFDNKQSCMSSIQKSYSFVKIGGSEYYHVNNVNCNQCQKFNLKNRLHPFSLSAYCHLK